MIDRAMVETCGVEKKKNINEEIFINKIIIKKYYLNKLRVYNRYIDVGIL